MSTLVIATRDSRTAFRPAEDLEGTVAWQLDEPAGAVELRLIWFTRGKGTVDVELVSRERYENPPREDEREFFFALPEAPYSFSGKLISLVWALEVVVERSKASERLEFVMAPEGREVLLHPRPIGAEV